MIDFKDTFDNLVTNTHTIHCITSPLAANDTANILLSLNQAPIMAEYKNEVADITKNADALLINFGTLNENKLAAIGESMGAASKHSIPIILDPVGVSASKVRLQAALFYLKKFDIRVLKANYSEIYSIFHNKLSTKGVDSHIIARDEIIEISKNLASMYNIIVVATGKEDIITDGNETLILQNGHEALSKITATGCMLGAIIAATTSFEMSIDAIALAISILNIAGELANKDSGMATFKISLLDEISLMKYEKLREHIRYERL